MCTEKKQGIRLTFCYSCEFLQKYIFLDNSQTLCFSVLPNLWNNHGTNHLFFHAWRLNFTINKRDINTAANYWSTFRALLHTAFCDRKIKEKPNGYFERIEDIPTDKELFFHLLFCWDISRMNIFIHSKYLNARKIHLL